MGKHLPILLFLCFLALSGSHASVSPEDYWKNKLPTTPMPQSIKDSLVPSGEVITNFLANTNGPYDWLLSYQGYDDGLLSYAKDSTKDLVSSTNESPKDSLKASAKSLIVDQAGYDGLLSYAEDSTKDSLTSTKGYDWLLSYQGYDSGLLSYAKDSTKDSLPNTNGYDGLSSAKVSAKNLISDGPGAYGGLLSYAKDSTKNSLASTKGYDGLLSYTKDSTKDSLASFNSYDDSLSNAKVSRKLLVSTDGYDGLLSYAEEPTSPSSINDIMKDQAFFVEANLHHGHKMNLVFPKGTKKDIIFFPRIVSSKIPFSSTKLSDIYNLFSINPKSQEAQVISERIKLCEEPKVENVEKKCVTSLESMVDFVISEIGDNVKALTTNLEKDYPKMEYTIEEVKKISKNDHETVVCHKLGYPYAVFFCHGTATIRAYKVSLVGNDGTRIEAIAACHKETNDFLTKYMVDVLKVVPGSTRICHFPGAEDNIIWVAK